MCVAVFVVEVMVTVCDGVYDGSNGYYVWRYL